MTYTRVIPRDLFNESKLLKCLGQVSLILLDRAGQYPLEMTHDADPGEGFVIDSTDSGELYAVNLRLVHTRTQESIDIYTPYNSRAPYPLCFDHEQWGPTYLLDDNGKFSAEFVEYIQTII